LETWPLPSDILGDNLGRDVQIEVMPWGKELGVLCHGAVDALIWLKTRVSMLIRPDCSPRPFPDVDVE